LILALFVSGCAKSLSGSAYERRQARTAHEVQMGVVESVREVQIEGTKSRVGATAGAVAGGVAGRETGHSPVGRAVGGVAGAVVGGVAGAAAEEVITRQKGLEITVKLDGGRMIAVTQAADEDFKAGDRVRVLFGGRGDTRVTH
jgi:outer membrane lipoprotein SlyB